MFFAPKKEALVEILVSLLSLKTLTPNPAQTSCRGKLTASYGVIIAPRLLLGLPLSLILGFRV